ncbi:MAG: hypothetical protein ABW128_07085 [Rhizorhabdus sp.]
MSDINFIAPTGHEIRGELQASEGAWAVIWQDESDPSAIDYKADGPDAHWDAAPACGLNVYVDGQGEHWLPHHLIIDGHDLPEAHVVDQWRAEVVRTKRGELLRQLAATYDRKSSAFAFWDEACKTMLHAPDTAPAVKLTSFFGSSIPQVSPERQALMAVKERITALEQEALRFPFPLTLPTAVCELTAIMRVVIETVQADLIARAR